MDKAFYFIMISAMYENGGNTLQRHFDGHPYLFSYPFESQVGNRGISDYLSSFVPHKYRWPQFRIDQSAEDIYEDFYDEEVKVRVKTPHISKFKDVKLQLIDKERKEIFVGFLKNKKITRANCIKALFLATTKAWTNYKKSGKEKIYVGYNPVQILDASRILEDFPDAKILHIVRNPFSAYAETKHRAAPLNLERYITTWNIVQLAAVSLQQLYPKNIFIVKYENLISDKKKFFTSLCKKLNIPFDKSLLYPSFNGQKVASLYPWGTIEYSTVKYNDQKIKELSKKEYETIKKLTTHWNEYFQYKNF